MPDYEALRQKLITATLFNVRASFVLDKLEQSTMLPVQMIKPSSAWRTSAQLHAWN
jgi:hypothetical protein